VISTRSGSCSPTSTRPAVQICHRHERTRRSGFRPSAAHSTLLRCSRIWPPAAQRRAVPRANAGAGCHHRTNQGRGDRLAPRHPCAHQRRGRRARRQGPAHRRAVHDYGHGGEQGQRQSDEPRRHRLWHHHRRRSDHCRELPAPARRRATPTGASPRPRGTLRDHIGGRAPGNWTEPVRHADYRGGVSPDPHLDRRRRQDVHADGAHRTNGVGRGSSSLHDICSGRRRDTGHRFRLGARELLHALRPAQLRALADLLDPQSRTGDKPRGFAGGRERPRRLSHGIRVHPEPRRGRRRRSGVAGAGHQPFAVGGNARDSGKAPAEDPGGEGSFCQDRNGGNRDRPHAAVDLRRLCDAQAARGVAESKKAQGRTRRGDREGRRGHTGKHVRAVAANSASLQRADLGRPVRAKCNPSCKRYPAPPTSRPSRSQVCRC
jgi:hypothetical protein